MGGQAVTLSPNRRLKNSLDEWTQTETIVTSVNGAVVFRITDQTVIIQLACDAAVIPRSEWEHICRAYGR